jgi:hypothetical protein
MAWAALLPSLRLVQRFLTRVANIVRRKPIGPSVPSSWSNQVSGPPPCGSAMPSSASRICGLRRNMSEARVPASRSRLTPPPSKVMTRLSGIGAIGYARAPASGSRPRPRRRSGLCSIESETSRWSVSGRRSTAALLAPSSPDCFDQNLSARAQECPAPPRLSKSVILIKRNAICFVALEDFAVRGAVFFNKRYWA